MFSAVRFCNFYFICNCLLFHPVMKFRFNEISDSNPMILEMRGDLISLRIDSAIEFIHSKF